jgi:hypothetical protein
MLPEAEQEDGARTCRHAGGRQCSSPHIGRVRPRQMGSGRPTPCEHKRCSNQEAASTAFQTRPTLLAKEQVCHLGRKWRVDLVVLDGAKLFQLKSCLP